MTEQRKATQGWYARWREHRRARGQRALERRYFEQQRARHARGDYVDANDLANAGAYASAYQTEAIAFWAALGGGDG